MRRNLRYRIICFLLGGLSSFLFCACGITSNSNSASLINCHEVQHASGKTCVPNNPQRLVTLSLPTLANALLLGIQPVGSTNQNVEEYTFPKYLEDKAKEIESLGGNAQPSIEKMTLLKPDLIFGWQVSSGAYSLLSKIAPTVLYDWQGTRAWRDYFNFMAKALNREEVAQKAWDDYYDRVEELKAALGDKYENKEISFVYFCCDGFRSQAPNSFSGSILEDIGLQRPESQAITSLPYGEISFSEEDIPKADGDILFVAAYFDSDRAYLNQIMEKPLWGTLRAVQQDRVYVVDAEIWRGGNLIAANALLDDLYKYLVNTP
jgi:iron complex transport system substrate-binding protein